jgi:hypothetical protein
MTQRCLVLTAAALATCGQLTQAMDVAFDADIVSEFLEYAETPVQSIKQRGDGKSPKNPIRSIKRTDKSLPTDKPFINFVTAPGV